MNNTVTSSINYADYIQILKERLDLLGQSCKNTARTHFDSKHIFTSLFFLTKEYLRLFQVYLI